MRSRDFGRSQLNLSRCAIEKKIMGENKKTGIQLRSSDNGNIQRVSPGEEEVSTVGKVYGKGRF